jgi:hypothetical protein
VTVYEVRTYNPERRRAGRMVRECTSLESAREICDVLALRKDKPHAVTCGQPKKILHTCDPGPKALRDLLTL